MVSWAVTSQKNYKNAVMMLLGQICFLAEKTDLAFSSSEWISLMLPKRSR